MRERKEIEKNARPFCFDGNCSGGVSQAEILLIEVLLDIRDLLTKKEDNKS